MIGLNPPNPGPAYGPYGHRPQWPKAATVRPGLMSDVASTLKEGEGPSEAATSRGMAGPERSRPTCTRVPSAIA